MGDMTPSSPVVFMFSGQGSQHFQMGRELYDANVTFRDSMARLDTIVRDVTGLSVIEAVYSESRRKGDPFARTLLTHPAIFMVEVSLAQSMIEAGTKPDIVLGASLGTFAAAAVAGFIDVDDALRAVIHQAAVFEQCGQPGGMIAVLGDPALFEEASLHARSELAAVNFSSHFVISAKSAALAGIEADLARRGVPYQRLPVSYPFHSQWVDEVRAPFVSFMRSIDCKRGRLPLACCTRAEVLDELPADFFWDVVRRPIRFRETAACLEQRGPHRYVDVGPSGTLATFLKYGLPATTRSTVHPVLTAFGIDRDHAARLLTSH